MEVDAKVFWLPKAGSSESEYEDAFRIGSSELRFAIADGATEASFSRLWAKQLVRAFTKNNLSAPIKLEELMPLQRSWEKIVHRRPLPWYADEKINDGAFAAFVGLEFLQDRQEDIAQKNWRATAAGDSCIVQVRGDEIISGFPINESILFNNRPNLLSSKPSLNGNELILNVTGSCHCDDVFFLMTDALACWFLKEKELGNTPWHCLRDLDTEGCPSFPSLIADLRSTGKIKNDDVTLLRIDVTQ